MYLYLCLYWRKNISSAGPGNIVRAASVLFKLPGFRAICFRSFNRCRLLHRMPKTCSTLDQSHGQRSTAGTPRSPWWCSKECVLRCADVATLVVDIGFNVPKKSEVLTVNGQLLHGTLKAVVGKDPLQVFSLHAPAVCRFPLAARRVLTFVAYGHAAFHRRRDGAVPPAVPQSLVVVAQQRR